jgi:hypothetical protein
MLRFAMLAFTLTLASVASTEPGKFEGVWKGGASGKPSVLLTILSDHPPRGTMAQGESSADLYIQDVKVVKGTLRFKTIDPNDGVVQYELKVVSGSEGTLSIDGKESVTLKRN